jgi:HAD superfamily hydrolase (TIGR01509 family)
MRFEAIIFDFDGVIVDSEWLANSVMADILTRHGHAVTAEHAIERYSGLRWADCHARIEEESGLRFDRDALGALVDQAVAARAAEALAIEGIHAFVERQSHRLLAVASSSEEAWLNSSLERLGLAGHFAGQVFSAARITRGKPHPDVYLQAAGKLGVAPSACLVIEDHPVGVAAGAAAGMTVVALLAASHIRDGHGDRVRAAGAHHVADDYEQVSEIIRKIEQG